MSEFEDHSSRDLSWPGTKCIVFPSFLTRIRVLFYHVLDDMGMAQNDDSPPNSWLNWKGWLVTCLVPNPVSRRHSAISIFFPSPSAVIPGWSSCMASWSRKRSSLTSNKCLGTARNVMVGTWTSIRATGSLVLSSGVASLDESLRMIAPVALFHCSHSWTLKKNHSLNCQPSIYNLHYLSQFIITGMADIVTWHISLRST